MAFGWQTLRVDVTFNLLENRSKFHLIFCGDRFEGASDLGLTSTYTAFELKSLSLIMAPVKLNMASIMTKVYCYCLLSIVIAD